MNILITGGSKGIGRATALRFAQEGNVVFINYAHDDEAAGRTHNEVAGLGAEAQLLKADLENESAITDMIGTIKERVSVLDAIVHCAVYPAAGSMFDISYHEWMKALRIDSLSLIEIVKQSLPLLKEGSSVIALSSRGATNPVPLYAALGSPKALTESIMKYMALELAPKGIRANVVSPGPIDTDAFRAVFAAEAEKRLQSARQRNPSGKNITFDDIADTIEFLAGPKAKMIQGRVIVVDGGLSLL